jgi:UDP-glucose 4-epimerase
VARLHGRSGREVAGGRLSSRIDVMNARGSRGGTHVRCVVTGAAGFLGSWLVRQLVREGHFVTVFFRGEPQAHRVSDWLGCVRVVRGSFQDCAGLSEKLTGETVDAFFHLAWSGVTADCRDDVVQISTNVVGSVRLWEIARDLGCKHWIGLGSQAEYGPRLDVLKEDLPLRPATAYGVAKVASAMLTAKMSEIAGMRHTWVRLLAIYGPGDEPKHLIPSTIRTLLAGNQPALTRGEQLWDYLYVEDAAKALARIAVTGATGSLNLASGQTVVIRKLVECLSALVGLDLPLNFGEVPYRPDQTMHLEADISRLRCATGWEPEVSLEEGLRRTIAWHKEGGTHAAFCR